MEMIGNGKLRNWELGNWEIVNGGIGQWTDVVLPRWVELLKV